MKLLVINGPNLNFLGIREPEVYGTATYQDLCDLITNYVENKDVELEIFQSNHEGDLVDCIQQAYYDKVEGIIINPAAYTHTSIALLDALKSVMIPAVEVHISDLTKREDFRQISYVGMAAKKTIKGHGFNGYLEAIDYLLTLK
ncbi:MAG: type II 3-dehydroquinate dehydratase [Bacilli bacterium]|nr:type II 3-dehydroquinate dehydratase [Bacilli bacterium]